MIKKRRAHALLIYSLYSNNLEVTVMKVRESHPISPNLNCEANTKRERQRGSSRCQFTQTLAELLSKRA